MVAMLVYKLFSLTNSVEPFSFCLIKRPFTRPQKIYSRKFSETKAVSSQLMLVDTSYRVSETGIEIDLDRARQK